MGSKTGGGFEFIIMTLFEYSVDIVALREFKLLCKLLVKEQVSINAQVHVSPWQRGKLNK